MKKFEIRVKQFEKVFRVHNCPTHCIHRTSTVPKGKPYFGCRKDLWCQRDRLQIASRAHINGDRWRFLVCASDESKCVEETILIYRNTKRCQPKLVINSWMEKKISDHWALCAHIFHMSHHYDRLLACLYIAIRWQLEILEKNSIWHYNRI